MKAPTISEVEAAHRATDNSTLRFGPADPFDRDFKPDALKEVGMMRAEIAKLRTEMKNSFRDECAMRAMEAMIAKYGLRWDSNEMEADIRQAFTTADAMVAERERRNQK